VTLMSLINDNINHIEGHVNRCQPIIHKDGPLARWVSSTVSFLNQLLHKTEPIIVQNMELELSGLKRVGGEYFAIYEFF